MKELYDYQQQGISLTRASLAAGNKRVVLQAPTGAGKSVIAAEIISRAVALGKRVIFVVPAISLINQSVQRFYEHGVMDIGVIQADHPMTNFAKPVQVASVQTLQNRPCPDADLVIIDEAHRWYAFYADWMAKWDNVPFIGLTATPWTKGLGRYYQDLIIVSTIAELISKGRLSPFRVFAPSHPDLSGVKTQAGDYHKGQLGKAMNKKELVADAVKTWLKYGEDRPTLCFGVDRAHAKHLQEQFLDAGVPAGYIDAYTPVEEREAIKKQLDAKKLKVVCNVGTLTTGVDWDIRCISLCRPTKSEMLHCQIIGRGLRTAEGKEDCLILDHSDTHLRLGFVTDIHHDKLCDGKPKKKSEAKPREEPLPKECPSCGYLKPAKVHECPNCGFKPKKMTDIVHESGELVEIKRKKKINKEATWEEKEKFYGELKSYAKSGNYNPHWADHKYREKFGVWPNKIKDAPLQEVSPETASWIKSRVIAWSRRKTA